MTDQLRVWAPSATQVEVAIAEGRHPMTREQRGWWSGPVLAPGTDYGFVVDGDGPFPDPRSPWQPNGVHGPSRVVDHRAFAWTDDDWRAPALADGVLYELHVGTFSDAGTFDGVAHHLDHLVTLGVTHVEIMPVGAFPGRHGWGYDGVALYAPHGPYGGPDGLKRLVNACHLRGLAVILDVVYNHLGPSGNYLSRFGPYFTDRYATPWGPAVNLDGAESDEVRRFFIDNALMWLRDYHLDGLRLDAVHALIDTSAIHFLEQLAADVRAQDEELGRRSVVIAESDLNDPRLVREVAAGGYGVDAQWSDDFHHALHAVITGERDGYYADFGTVAHLATALRQAYVYDGRYSAFRRRRHGRPAAGVPGHRFLGYAQNHDQIGNRCAGERLGHLASVAHAKIAAAIVLTAPFVPMLFQGEEWLATAPFRYFTDHDDPALADAVRRGRQEEFAAFGWRPEDVPDPQDAATFAASRLDWSERSDGEHAEMLDWYRRLIALRRELPELRDGDLGAVDVDAGDDWLAITRGRITVACNFSTTESVAVRLAAPATVLRASAPEAHPRRRSLALPKTSVAILRLERDGHD